MNTLPFYPLTGVPMILQDRARALATELGTGYKMASRLTGPKARRTVYYGVIIDNGSGYSYCGRDRASVRIAWHELIAQLKLYKEIKINNQEKEA